MTTPTVNVNDLTFGVELEVTLPLGTCTVGGYHAGVQVPVSPSTGPVLKARASVSFPPT